MSGGAAGWANADGTYDVAAGLLNVSTVASAEIRFGFIVKSTTANTVGGGNVAGFIEVYQ